MARMARDRKLDSRTARSALSARNSPYWCAIAKGRAIGYRKGRNGGSWIARYRSASGERHQLVLGPADDLLDDHANAVLTFDQAQAKARGWFGEIESNEGRRFGSYTVDQALEDYLDAFGGRSKDKTRWVADRYIRAPLGHYQVRQLTTEMISRFHRELAETPAGYRWRKDGSRKLRPASDSDARTRKASANRVLTVLKAALNHAFNHGRAASDLAWRRVKPFAKVDAPRIRYLDPSEAIRLVNAASVQFRPLIQAALLTGGRWSEIHRIRASDVDLVAGAVHFPDTKSGKPRWAHLSDEGLEFFRRQCAGKQGSDLLFLNEHGREYGRSHQVRPMQAASAAAGLQPAGFHVLRHTYGTRLAMAGVPMAVIAEALGHADERITRKHYAHLSPSYVRDVVRAGLGRLGIFQDNNVKQLKSAHA